MKDCVKYVGGKRYYFLNGKPVTCKEFRKYYPVRKPLTGKMTARKYGQWPFVCDASGVIPQQIKAETERLAKMGVPTEFSADGGAILRDRGHRRRYLKAIGLVDKGGYD